VVVQESIEGNSLTVSTSLKGEPLKIEGSARIEGKARTAERRCRPMPILKGEAVRREDQRFKARCGVEVLPKF